MCIVSDLCARHGFTCIKDRLYRPGRDKMETAVAISPGYGAGLTSWNRDLSPMLPELVLLAFARNGTERNTLLGLVHKRVPNFCDLGLSDIEIEWLPVGTWFEITEYDGAESINTKEFPWQA